MFDTAQKQGLHLSNLRYSHRGADLIDIEDLQLGSSGVTVIMGPNGAGKSLLLRLIHGLLPPTSGNIRYDGQRFSPDVSRQQALVFQTPVLLRRTVEANLRFVLKIRGLPEDRVDPLLRSVGLADKHRTPARRLSGGERQRLAIAQAMATEPKHLSLDEPTASLDPASVLAIEKIVADVAARGVRIVFVTHDAGQARRLADDVVFMSNGQVVEHTPASHFFETPETQTAQDYLAGRLTPEV